MHKIVQIEKYSNFKLLVKLDYLIFSKPWGFLIYFYIFDNKLQIALCHNIGLKIAVNIKTTCHQEQVVCKKGDQCSYKELYIQPANVAS